MSKVVSVRRVEIEKNPVTGVPTRVGEFVVERALGFGATASVVVARKEGADVRVAIKVMRGGSWKRKRFLQEAALHRRCHHHPNIPVCHEVLGTRHRVMLVMDCVPGTDLFERVAGTKARLRLPNVRALMCQLVSTVHHLHNTCGVAHRDIKPENIVLSPDGTTAVLCDFGFAVEWREGDRLLADTCGTPRCLPPEVFDFCKHSKTRGRYNPRAVDMFGLGAVMFFALTGRFPFEGPTDKQTAWNTVHNKPTAPAPNNLPEECADLLWGLLAADPEQRLSAASAMSHPFILAGTAVRQSST